MRSAGGFSPIRNEKPQSGDCGSVCLAIFSLEKILFVFDLVHEPGDVLPRFFAERRADDLDDLTCTSKGAVLAMTRALAVEWAQDNITVNSIAPGWFRSKMNEQVVDAAREQKILNRMPLHAYGDTRDLGKMAEFLVGDGASYITGQDFAVDGGALAFGY